jgi:hypothetical protein
MGRTARAVHDQDPASLLSSYRRSTRRSDDLVTALQTIAYIAKSQQSDVSSFPLISIHMKRHTEDKHLHEGPKSKKSKCSRGALVQTPCSSKTHQHSSCRRTTETTSSSPRMVSLNGNTGLLQDPKVLAFLRFERTSPALIIRRLLEVHVAVQEAHT